MLVSTLLASPKICLYAQHSMQHKHHLSGSFQWTYSSCKFLLGVFIAVLSIAALSSEHVWPFLANSRTFDVQRISMIFQCAIPYFDWIFSFDHACVFLELYKHYLARKCWTYIRRQGVLNSCCKGPLVIKLQVRFVIFFRVSFYHYTRILLQAHTTIRY